jgi:hypothetical protein
MQEKIDYEKRWDYREPPLRLTSVANQEANFQDKKKLTKADELFLFDPKVWIPLVPFPTKIEFNRPVRYIACGAFHSMCLTEDG